MTSDPLDLGALLCAADQDTRGLQPLAAGTVVGHVHLHVLAPRARRANSTATRWAST